MNKKKLRKKGLPTYEIVVNMEDETGVRLVSLVKSPAIELKGMYFNEDDTEIIEKEHMFVSNKDEQMIIGPALVPYKKIYRVDPDTGEEYNVVFTPDSIKNIVNKFNKSNNNKSINLEHTNQMVDGYIAENWIVKNSVYDTSRAYGLNLQEGSWVICVKIEDKNFWANEVKEQGIYGFSVEGLLGQKLISLTRIELSVDKIDKAGIVDGRQFEEMLSQLSGEELIELSDDILEYIDLEFGRKRYDLQPDDYKSHWHTHPKCNCTFNEGIWTFEETEEYPCDLCIEMSNKYKNWYSKRGTGKSAAPSSKSFSK